MSWNGITYHLTWINVNNIPKRLQVWRPPMWTLPTTKISNFHCLWKHEMGYWTIVMRLLFNRKLFLNTTIQWHLLFMGHGNEMSCLISEEGEKPFELFTIRNLVEGAKLDQHMWNFDWTMTAHMLKNIWTWFFSFFL